MRLSEANQGAALAQLNVLIHLHATQCSTVSHERFMQSFDTYRARCPYEQLTCLLAVFCTGGPRTRTFITYIIWYGHCRLHRPTVSDVSSDPYQILYIYQHTHIFIVTVSLPVDGLLPSSSTTCVVNVSELQTTQRT